MSVPAAPTTPAIITIAATAGTPRHLFATITRNGPSKFPAIDRRAMPSVGSPLQEPIRARTRGDRDGNRADGADQHDGGSKDHDGCSMAQIQGCPETNERKLWRVPCGRLACPRRAPARQLSRPIPSPLRMSPIGSIPAAFCGLASDVS